VRVRVHPEAVVLAPGQTRGFEVVADPDFCDGASIAFESDDPSVVAPPAPVEVWLGRARVEVSISAGAEGAATLTARLARGDGTDATAALSVAVASPQIAACSGSGAGRVDDGESVRGSESLAAASVGLQAGATRPNSGSFLWHVDPFDATLECADDQVPDGWLALGPAVRFGPSALSFRREIPLSVPVSPAAMPEAARLRHVAVSYSGPRAAEARPVPIANPRLVHGEAGWELSFLAPWLGTYQAIVRADAGQQKRTRRITHRAVVGISMGGGGTAMVGLRHHHLFDVVAPLGGPVDWTWLLGHIEANHVGGFLPNDGTTPPAGTAELPEPTLPYEHPSSFDRWWYEYPKNGNGGSFPRAEYVQIFRDLALMFGNPNGYNPTPGAENLPAGVDPGDPSVVGDHGGRECAVWIDPIDGHPDNAEQQKLAEECPLERCRNTLVLEGYYDDEFNPKGTFPVITVCDGSPQDETLSPWANTWKPEGNDRPLEVALAVDYDGDGVRDENEPILRQGHEPFDDHGSDGIPSAAEPGYVAGTNDDPSGDDWHPQFNPAGTENNSRFDPGEPYRDFGLDGVDGTASSPYDWGEGNGEFDWSPGWRTFLERDSRSVLEQLAWTTHPQPFDDEAMARLDLWTDGGTRDLFNFAVDAQALAGAWAARGRVVHYYTGFHHVPGQVPDDPKQFVGGNISWADVPSGALLRYGQIDPTQKDIDSGSGQHVGTADEVTRRLQASLYYIGSRWPDAPHTLDIPSNLDPDPEAESCAVTGSCDFEFTDSRGRTGPVSVNLPPGYAHVESRDKRYPVIYMLHGYGQTPDDLKAAILFLQNWMNSPADSQATRLPKAILIYVDGRCRPGEVEAECIRGTFFTDSVREHGPKMESWWLELMDEVDRRFRTMPEAEIEWTL
jgi:hypothetical protein